MQCAAGQSPEAEIQPAAAFVSPPENGTARLNGGPLAGAAPGTLNLPALLSLFEEHPFNPAPESHLIDLHRPMETPSEEFRSLRTKLNHMQNLQSLHTVVVTSASPAEGKSFTAMNLALAESHLADNVVLIADFDLRRPTLHNLLQLERSPGISDYLLGEAPIEKVIKRISGSNLYFLPAGKPVKNPLELLNLREVRTLIHELHTAFKLVFLRYAAAAVFRRRQSAGIHDRRNHPGSADRTPRRSTRSRGPCSRSMRIMCSAWSPTAREPANSTANTLIIIRRRKKRPSRPRVRDIEVALKPPGVPPNSPQTGR